MFFFMQLSIYDTYVCILKMNIALGILFFQALFLQYVHISLNLEQFITAGPTSFEDYFQKGEFWTKKRH